MITQDQLKDVLERADALHRYLDIDKKKIGNLPLTFIRTRW